VKFGEGFGGEAFGESRRSGRHDHHEICVDGVGINNELIDDLDESAPGRGLRDLVEAYVRRVGVVDVAALTRPGWRLTVGDEALTGTVASSRA